MKPTIGSKAKAQMKQRAKSRNFVPDTRGIGGKQLVVEILALHQYRLNKIKTTAKAAPPPPPKIKGAGQYSTNAHKLGFSGPPSTYNLAPKLSQARRAHIDEGVAEHQNRRDHMARRMHEYPNRKDREQNRMDPVAHPVMLIRSDDGGPKRVFYANPFDPSDIRPVAGPPSPGRLARSATSTSPLRPGTALDGASSGATRSSAALRPNTAPNKDGFMFSRPLSQPNLHGGAAGRGRSPSPPRYAEEKVPSGDPYERLREKLLGLIVQHRIIKEANLKQLFDKAIAINSHLDPVRLTAVIDGLRRELVDMPSDDAASAVGSAAGSSAGAGSTGAGSSGAGSGSAVGGSGAASADVKHSAPAPALAPAAPAAAAATPGNSAPDAAAPALSGAAAAAPAVAAAPADAGTAVASVAAPAAAPAAAGGAAPAPAS